MLIAVNAGNNRVLLGGYEEDERIFAASIATEPRQMPEDMPAGCSRCSGCMAWIPGVFTVRSLVQ